MNDFGKTATRLSKNPLGIIALAFVFVYGIAGLFTSQTSLDSNSLFVLVIFLVSFPCLVLFVFYLLVTKHHTKLYAPSDYTDEENFIKTLEIKVSHLEETTAQINALINNQPLYRYTKLKETGKLLVLDAYTTPSFDLLKFAEYRKIEIHEVKEQAQIICKYGWCTLDTNLLKVTDQGLSEIGTFQDICYGRMS